MVLQSSIAESSRIIGIMDRANARRTLMRDYRSILLVLVHQSGEAREYLTFVASHDHIWLDAIGVDHL